MSAKQTNLLASRTEKPARGQAVTPVLPTDAGPPSDAWTDMLAEQAVLTLWSGVNGSKDRTKQIEAVLDALENIAPRDELEGMMVAQMIAAHSAVMECFRRAMIPEQNMLSREENLAHATKVMRSFTALVEAFNKHRGKSQQKVEVRHVHVHGGGQAVVGIVPPNRGE